jgi:hypothetical protein
MRDRAGEANKNAPRDNAKGAEKKRDVKND